MAGKCHIGTSGWSYDHWAGLFYPQDLPAKARLSHYVKFFSTVEINNTFYHLPKEATFQAWHESVPPDFLFAVKASRFITHVKRLKEPAEPLNNFLSRANLLKNNLGPTLFQLPPGWALNLIRFEEFISQLPSGFVFAFEFRNKSWYDTRVYDLMEKAGLTFCIHDMAGSVSPVMATSNQVYIRFHGTAAGYSGKYSRDQLRGWAGKVLDFLKKGAQVYIYFNNDAFGFAIENAGELERLLKDSA